MKSRFLIMALLFLILQSPQCLSAPIPPLIKKIVTFIYKSDTDGQLQPQGTAFFIEIQNLQRPEIRFLFLVTAKHVLLTEGKKSWLPQIFVRLNTRDGKAKEIPISIISEGQNRNVYFDPDSSVDLAIIPFRPDIQLFDYQFLSEDFLTTKDDIQKLKITEGADVFFTGLFTPYTGEQQNYPIVRFGKMALITQEKINFDGGKSYLSLIEANVFGGNSGAPTLRLLSFSRSGSRAWNFECWQPYHQTRGSNFWEF